jgi:predicted nucleic acid-binding protein
MILVDAGPLVALFDRRDEEHETATKKLAAIREPLLTTVSVLTEATYMLGPGSTGSDALRQMVRARGLGVWFFRDESLRRAFELMERYSDHPMDLADASLVVAAEDKRTTSVWSIDRRDFLAYRARMGKTLRGFRLV